LLLSSSIFVSVLQLQGCCLFFTNRYAIIYKLISP
jgi:hypothetical protein